MRIHVIAQKKQKERRRIQKNLLLFAMYLLMMHLEQHIVHTAQNVGITKYVDTAVVGYLMQKEIDFLGNAVNNPESPFRCNSRWSKRVSSKISVIENLIDKVDTLIIGGGMSYTFSKAQGGTVGNSFLMKLPVLTTC